MKIKITELTSATAIASLIGAYIFNKISGRESQADKIKNSVSSHDKAIEKQLDVIDKGIAKNAKVVKQQVAKLPKERQDDIQKLAKLFDY